MKKLILSLAFGSLGTLNLSAITIADYSDAVNARFDSGFNTASPVLNASPSFVGAGYDWSGIGWNTSPGDSHRVQSFAMLSPVSAFSASHYPLDQSEYPSGDTVRTEVEFVNAAGTVINGSIARSVGALAGTDIRITNLTQALTAADHVSVLRILDISSGQYSGQPALLVGSVMPGNVTSGGTTFTDTTSFQTGPLVATATVRTAAARTITPNTYASSSSLSFVEWEPGDSGSPFLMTYNGTLTIAGAAWYAGGTSSSLIPVSGYDPTTPVNAVLGQNGYAEKWTIYDVPSDSANTANRWTGSAGSSAFGTTGNWSAGAVPSNLPVVFDASSNNGQATISLGASQALRGMLFVSGGSSGFTFAAGNTLSIGATGIRNESSSAQTFNSAMALSGNQNWEAVNGDLVFNGNIANAGYMAVIGGAMNTTIAGVLSGVGGLAKDDAGTLFLNGENTYSGRTWIHNGTVMLGSASALGASGQVTFNTLNPDATLNLNGYSIAVADINSGTGLPIQRGSGKVQMSGGNLSVGGVAGLGYTSTYAGGFNGSGNLTKTGFGTWVLAGNSLGFSGAISINSGNLSIQGTMGSSNSVSVAVGNGSSAAMLSGNGTINGSVVLKNKSTLAPSGALLGVNGYMQAPPGATGTTLNIAGGLMWDGGAQLKMQLVTPASSDLINLGSSGFSKGLAGTYQFSFFNQGSWVDGNYVPATWTPGTYTLVTFGSTSFSASDFTFAPIEGYTGTFSLSGSSLTFQLQTSQSSFQTIPEPSSLILICLALLGVTAARWCRGNGKSLSLKNRLTAEIAT